MAHSGGLFKITPELIAFVKTWPIDELYIEDVYKNTIAIDLKLFLFN